MTCSLEFLTSKHYISKRIGWSVLVFENLYGKVVIDQFPISSSPKNFRREIITEKKENARNFSGQIVEHHQSNSTLCLWWVSILVQSVRNQLFLAPYYFETILELLCWNFSAKFCGECWKNYVIRQFHHLRGVQIPWFVFINRWLTVSGQINLFVRMETPRC